MLDFRSGDTRKLRYTPSLSNIGVIVNTGCVFTNKEGVFVARPTGAEQVRSTLPEWGRWQVAAGPEHLCLVGDGEVRLETLPGSLVWEEEVPKSMEPFSGSGSACFLGHAFGVVLVGRNARIWVVSLGGKRVAETSVGHDVIGVDWCRTMSGEVAVAVLHLVDGSTMAYRVDGEGTKRLPELDGLHGVVLSDEADPVAVLHPAEGLGWVEAGSLRFLDAGKIFGRTADGFLGLGWLPFLLGREHLVAPSNSYRILVFRVGEGLDLIGELLAENRTAELVPWRKKKRDCQRTYGVAVGERLALIQSGSTIRWLEHT